MSKRKGIGNVHTHHIDLRCLPENIIKQQSNKPEWIKYTIAYKLAKTNKYVKTFLDIMGDEKYKDFNLAFHKISEIHFDHMSSSNVDYSVVLLNDYKYTDPDAKDPNHAYDYVVQHTAQACARYPFSFFLFYGFDPRAPNALKMLKESYKNYCYVGIKFYPSMGFDPRINKSKYISGEDYYPYKKNDIGGDEVLKNIKAMFNFAGSKNLPILLHSSSGGTYMATIKKKSKYEHIWRYTEPSNFLDVARDKELRICFGHMGGKADPKDENKAIEILWHNQILNLIKHAAGWSSKGRFFADQSYNIIHLLNETGKKGQMKDKINKTKEYLEDKHLGKYLLYGTDWPLNLFKSTEKQYIKAYKEIFDVKKLRDKYFSDNIARFLFGDSKKIPQNYVDYLKKENPQFAVPDWVKEENGEYFLV